MTVPWEHTGIAAMIPYLEIPPLRLGAATVQPFGALVIAGCLAGYATASWYAGKTGLDRSNFRPLVTWVLVAGFLLAQWTSLLISHPGEVLHRPQQLLAIGSSMFSFGGFFGGAVAAVIYTRRRNLPVLPYIDALVMGLATGWFFGRLGCTLAHDHPGLPSEFFLAVRYPGGPRHDLGWYEWLLTMLLLAVVFALRPWRFPPGVLTGMLCLLYAPARFLLDFLRVGERSFLGLTPGQYFSVLLLGIGLWLLSGTAREMRDS